MSPDSTSSLSTTTLSINENNESMSPLNSSSTEQQQQPTPSSTLELNTSGAGSEMLHLFQQLEQQQIANYLLKNKIASLQQTSSTFSKQTSNETVGGLSSSMPATPTPMLNTDSLIQSLLVLSKSNTSSSSRNYLSKDDLVLAKHRAVDKSLKVKNKGFLNSLLFGGGKQRHSSADTARRAEFDCLLDGDLFKTSETDNMDLEVRDENEESSSNSEDNRDESSELKRSKMFRENKAARSSVNGGGASKKARMSNEESSDKVEIVKLGASVKTPKSALLERRRKAVFELLTHEIYPSGNFRFILFELGFRREKN